MNMRTIMALCSLAVVCVAPSGVVGQSAPPTYQADPEVYKVIFENENFRVIEATHKKGMPDKMHIHAVPSITYYLTDCTTKHYFADGTSREDSNKAGTVRPLSSAAPHSAEIRGPDDCRQIFVERK